MAVTHTLSVTNVPNSVDTVNNTSQVKILWQSTQTGESYNLNVKTAKYWITINYGDETEYSVRYILPLNSTRTLVDKIITVTHRDDGTGTVSVRTWMDTGISAGVVTKSQSLTLPAIPRASTIDYLSCATKYFNGKLTYKYTVNNAKFYNRCNISVKIDGEYKAVKSIDLGKQSVSQKTATVTFDKDELSAIYNELPTTTKGTLRFTFRTYSDSGYKTQVGEHSYKEITLYIPDIDDTKPTVTMTLSPVTSLDSPFDTLYIRGRSKVKASFSNGEGKHGADIVSYEMRVNGKSYSSPYTSGYLSSSGSVTVKGIVTDSRGFSREYEQSITVISYGDPKLLPASDESEIICARCDKDGNLTESGTYLKIKAKRSYYKVTSDGEQNNFCTIRYRYVPEGTKFTGDEGWVTLLEGSDTSTDTVNKTLSGVVTSIEKAYVVQVGVIDDIGESDAVQFMIPTDFVTVDVPEAYKGRSIGIFRHAVEPDGDEKRIDMDGVLHGGGVDNLTLGEMLTATDTAPLDLNDYTVPGNYYSPTATNSEYITNTPYTEGGFSLTVRHLQSENMIRQELFYGRTNWQRHYNSSSKTWSEWLRYLMTSFEDSTAADFVTEIGISYIDPNDTDKGYWRYRKWKSGALDMNGFFKVAPETDTAQGTEKGYWSKQIEIDLPFPVSNFQFTGTAAVYFILFANANIIEDNKIRFRLFRFADFADLSDKDVYVRIIASGKYT